MVDNKKNNSQVVNPFSENHAEIGSDTILAVRDLVVKFKVRIESLQPLEIFQWISKRKSCCNSWRIRFR